MVHTGASLFFNLDVTHSRSAFAKRGCREAVGLEVSNLKIQMVLTKTKLSLEKGKEVERLQHQQDATVEIYHFLSRALGEGVAIAQIVDFDVANEITILGVNVGVQPGGTRGLCSTSGRAFGLRMTSQRWEGVDIGRRVVLAYRTDWGNIDVLDTLASLDLCIDLCGSCSGGGSRVSRGRTVCGGDRTTSTLARLRGSVPGRARATVEAGGARIRLGLIETRSFARFVRHGERKRARWFATR